MPSKSVAQHRLMAAVAHNPAFAKKVGIVQDVGKDFVAADKGTKMKPPFMGKETAKEEAAEKRKFPGKKAYKAAEKKFEGHRYAAGGVIRGNGAAVKAKKSFTCY